ncbi:MULTISPECIES: hypothetical protein [unclassified Streptomyces]|uniref:hypothetical protein n=1 Tax=unclassified Streptomyces TaxID=2593676 RepID=UPI00381857BA
MISKDTLKGLGLGAVLGSAVFATDRLFGEDPAGWLTVVLILGILADYLWRGIWVSRSGYWVTRGVDSEDGDPCWLVKGGPFADEDDTIAELGTWREARRYVRRSERLATEAYRRYRQDRTRG